MSAVFPTGELSVLLGPSGSGKSTLLRLFNRLLEPDEGVLLVDGADARGLDPVTLRRNTGYAIQGVGLFPHMSVAENIAVVPRLLGWDRDRIGRRVRELLEAVRLPASFASRRPRELSGGEAQRVGVARALAADPPVLLMDEPFGALDALTREALQVEFARIQGRLRKTVVFVTHDLAEAVLLADRLFILREGRLLRSGSPRELLAAAGDDFVADFLGARFGIEMLGRESAAAAAEYAGSGPAGGLIASAADLGGAAPLGPEASLRDALARMIAEGRTALPVEGPRGRGLLRIEAIALAGRAAAGAGGNDARR
ncbi:MAG: ABC transporter ATP-binding protein [Spirochaetaceae bacterium]|nr:ABC transporter ATP-binding protein [Spirochaetaceae bacterium]